MTKLWLPPRKQEPKKSRHIQTFVRELKDAGEAVEWISNIVNRGAKFVACLEVFKYDQFGDAIGCRPVVVYQHDYEFDYEELC